jgi:competence protein ComEC
MGTTRFALPVALAAVSVGILAADSLTVPIAALLTCGIGLSIGGVIIGPRGAVMWLAGLACLTLSLGAWRGEAMGTPIDPARSVASLADGAEHQLAGTVLDDPRPREDRLQLVLGAVVATHGDARVAFEDRLLVWVPRGLDAHVGDRLLVSSEVELAEDFDGFAYRAYLLRQGIGAIARARSASIQSSGAGGLAALAAIRSTLLGGLNDLVPEPEAALGAGILLGVRASIAPEINDAFATAGLTHVVAISGWNIAIVAAIVMALVRPVGRVRGGRWMTSAAAMSIVGGYVLLTGASPSVVRAALMAAAMLLARHGGSRAHAASALALAALLMLVVAPPVLWDVGFQLSLLATAGLIWFGASVERRLSGWPGWLREPVALTLAAQLTTLPVILVNFERLSLVAPIANLLVVPFVPVAMLFSAIAALVGALVGALPVPLLADVAAWLAGGAAWLVLRIIVSLGTAVASIPHAAVPVSVPPACAVAWFPILVLGSWALRSPGGEAPRAGETEPPSRATAIAVRLTRPIPILGALIVTLGLITAASQPDGMLHVTALDVGQGDAILLETPGGHAVLVDGGPDPELTLRRLGANLPFFDRGIDLLVLTHPHQDHVAGLVDVLGRFGVGAVLHAGIPFENASYDRLLADAAAGGVPVGLARAGQVIDLDASATLEVIYPTAADAAAPLPDDDINNGSIVLVLRYEAFVALLTGDAEAPVEARLLARHEIPLVDLLKVGHHGSRSSTTPAFLDAAQPTVAMISAGIDNDYGHPAPETLAALAARPGLTIARTDLQGDLELETDGHAFRLHTDAGWSTWRAVHAAGAAASIGRWLCRTEPPRCECSPTRACPRGSSSTRGASLASLPPLPGSWPRPRSRSTGRSSRRRRCSTTSTRRPRGGVPTTASSGPGSSSRWATVSSPCRSPPTQSPRCSTTIATPSAGHRSSSPWPIAMLRSPS